MAALENGGEEAKDFILDGSLRGKNVPIGRTDALQARGAAMPALGGHVEHTSLLLVNQGYVGPQGSPSGNPRIQISDSAAAQLHSGPITSG
jgi:hypothetical protein